ncbi:MAG: AMP-binding protein [Myxococcaceae bacterium]
MIVNFKGSKGTLLKTSGSMGVPKEVFHTLEQHVLASRAVISNTQLDSNSCSLLSLPLSHIGGLAILVRAYVSGGRSVLPEKGWNPDWAVNQAGVTHMSLVSTQLMRFMQDSQSLKAMRKLKAILLGGSAINKSLIEKAYQEDLPIIMTYGSTETCSQVTATRLGDSLDRLLTSGKCLPDRELKISETGEILVKGDMIYVPGFYATGDLGHLDSLGYLHVLGRRDNRMISGGENIYPEEIERVLLEHPEVDSVVVCAKNDEEFGQRPVVFVKMQPDFELDSENLKNFLLERIERFKIPKDWRPWPSDFPDTPKISRSFFAKLVD